MKKIYADNAATTRKKPPCVWEAMENYMKEIGTSPGRGGYLLGLEADRIIFSARKKISELFGSNKIKNVFFSLNATHAINVVLKGFLKKGDHVITSSMEHNAVARPLTALKNSGVISLTKVKCSEEGILDPEDVIEALEEKTALIALTHASNVTGTIMPVGEVGKIAAERGIFYLLDCAQTAGVLPVNASAFQADAIAFTGHKGLFGPQGTGGCFLSDRAAREVFPLLQGGTGSKSDLLNQPDFMPDKFESGTPNTVGLAGLNASLGWISRQGMAVIRKHEEDLTRYFLDGLWQFGKKVVVYGPKDASKQTSTVSINLKGLDAGEVSFILDRVYGIMTRSGLHCAPWAHKTIGSFPKGTLRFSFSYFNSREEIDYILNALKEILDNKGSF